MSFKAAIIGRPNVGKSTLFNRLVGTKAALVHNKPGLTRDRKEAEASIADLSFTLIDTAGLELAENGSMEELMMKQTYFAMEEADILILMIDGREGLTALDEHFAKLIRKKSKPTILVVNKTESEKNSPGIYECYKLGLGEPVLISAEHGIGLGDLHDELEDWAKKEFYDLKEQKKSIRDDLSIAFVGRPNAGKSSLFNAILKKERSIASEIPGTTRDSIFEYIRYKDRTIKIVDTAGIRKKFKKGDFLEEISVQDSLKAIGFANIVILTIDATHGIDKIELSLADRVFEEGKALIFLINKWDAIDDEAKENLLEDIEDKLDYSLAYAKSCKVFHISAIVKRNRKNINKVLDNCLEIYEAWNTEISTGKLNNWLKKATEENIPPISAGKRIKLKYITQVATRPPTFAIFTSSNLKQMPDSYKRYLKNSLRETFDIEGVPIRISIRKTRNPYEDSVKAES